MRTHFETLQPSHYHYITVDEVMCGLRNYKGAIEQAIYIAPTDMVELMYEL